MRILYLDCGMGAAGDMLMSALLELVPDKDNNPVEVTLGYDDAAGYEAGLGNAFGASVGRSCGRHGRAETLQPAEQKLPQHAGAPADRRDCRADHRCLRHAAGAAAEPGGQADRCHLSGVRPGAVHDL